MAIICHINRMKEGEHIIISIDAEKVFNIIQIGRQGNFLNMIKGIYEKLTANIIIHGERLRAFLLRNKTRILLSLLVFNIEILLARAIRQEII